MEQIHSEKMEWSALLPGRERKKIKDFLGAKAEPTVFIEYGAWNNVAGM